MHKRTIRVIAVIAAVIVTLLAGANRASAAGAVNISGCGTLSTFGTVYRLTADLTSCGDCLVVANNQITVDLQDHSITSTCSGNGAAITDQFVPRDVVVVRNGSVIGYESGVALQVSTRVSVLGVTAKNNTSVGIMAGARSLVKSSEAFGNFVGIEVGDRGQVQQSNAHDNVIAGIASFVDPSDPTSSCLITMNTANNNGQFGIITLFGNRCTVSFNTANTNGFVGIDAGASTGGKSHVVTANVALNNANFDYAINCPSTVTNNDSTNGFPASYVLIGNGCQTSNNH